MPSDDEIKRVTSSMCWMLDVLEQVKHFQEFEQFLTISVGWVVDVDVEIPGHDYLSLVSGDDFQQRGEVAEELCIRHFTSGSVDDNVDDRSRRRAQRTYQGLEFGRNKACVDASGGKPIAE